MFYPLRIARAYNLMGQAELNIGWRNGSALAELAGKQFRSPRNLLRCEWGGASSSQHWPAEWQGRASTYRRTLVILSKALKTYIGKELRKDLKLDG